MSLTTGQTPLIEPAAEQGGPSLAIAYVLWLLLGLISGHRFYLGKPLSAVLQIASYLFLVGFLWWAADAFLMPGLIAARRKQLRDGPALSKTQAHQQQQSADQAWLDGYKGWTSFASPYDRSFIAVDFDRSMLDIGKVGAVKRFAFADITSADLAREMVTNTSGYVNSNTIMQTNTTSVQRLSRLCLKVSVEDGQSPYFEVLFFFLHLQFNPTELRREVAAMQTEAEKFHALLAAAIAKTKGATPAQTATNGAATDELEKLWALKQAGALTDAEYSDQKAKILGAS